MYFILMLRYCHYATVILERVCHVCY